MRGLSDLTLASRFRSFSQISSVFAIAVGLLTLVGWLADIQVLKSIAPLLPSMKANSALCLVLAGLALWLLQDRSSLGATDRPRKDFISRNASIVCAGSVALVACLTFLEYALGWDFRIDQLLFNDSGGPFEMTPAGRMAPATAMDFLFLSVALILLTRKADRAYRASQFLSLAVGVLSLLALVGYVYGTYQTYGLTYHRSMALHEAGALVIFSAAVLFARPQSGYVLTMTGQGHVGILVRRLLPWAVGVPFLLGWLRLEAERNGIQLTDIEFSLFVVSNMVIFSVLIWASARSLVATEQELVESEERYRSIFENSEDAILLTVPEGRILAANLAACRMFGRSEEEICQAGRRGLVDLSDPRLPLALEEGERTGRFKGELTFVRRNGERFPAEVTSTVFHDSQRNPHTSMIIRDITERKCAEEALRQSEERLRLITDNMLDMVSQLNMDGIHVYVSPAHKRALGYDPGEMLGKSIYEYLHPDDRERVTAAIQASLQSGSTGRAEFRYRHADGHYVWLETAGSLLFDDNGSSIGAILSGRDISERKRAEEELKTAKSRLQRLSHRLLEVQENDRRAIARELHDEIGQILTAAKIDLQVVRRGNIPEDLAARLDEDIASLDNCLSRVRNLSLDLRPSMLDDLGLVAALRWQLNRQAERAGFQVHLVAEDAPERLHPELETVCYRIVQEALTNIAKHAHAHNVWVELTSSDREVLLSVRDDGVGFHVESALADAAHGVSFGILGMQERASLLGGKLEIVSARGKGTTVTARFPL